MSGKWWLASAASAVLALTAAACGSSDGGFVRQCLRHLAGAGSSAQQAAQEAWIAKFQERQPGRDRFL